MKKAVFWDVAQCRYGVNTIKNIVGNDTQFHGTDTALTRLILTPTVRHCAGDVWIRPQSSKKRYELSLTLMKFHGYV
jgi:hypothetical protein